MVAVKYVNKEFSVVFILRLGWFDLFCQFPYLNILLISVFLVHLGYMCLQKATSWVWDKVRSDYAAFARSLIQYSFKKSHSLLIPFFKPSILLFSPQNDSWFLHFPAAVYSSALHPSRESIKSPDAAPCWLLGRSRVQSCYMAQKLGRHVSLPQAH